LPTTRADAFRAGFLRPRKNICIQAYKYYQKQSIVSHEYLFSIKQSNFHIWLV